MTEPWSPRTYDGLATAYATANTRMRHGLAAHADRLLAHAGSGPMLELGCGHGRDLRYLAERGANVFGMDRSAGMLAHGVARVPLVQADIRRIPVRSGALAGCWCMATLLHLTPEELPVVFAELARITAVGGMLVLGTQRGDSSALEPDPYTGRYLRRMSRYPERTVVDGLTERGFRVRVEPTGDSADLRHWVLVTALRRAD